MIDDEGADGGQLGEGVRPGRDGEAVGGQAGGEVFEHVVARVVAERHQKRAEKHGALGMRAKTRAQEVGRGDKDVGAAAGAQHRLKLGKRGSAFRTAMTGKRDDASWRRR